jgi:hypothetical protein
VKVAHFTVRATELQSARWKQCAIADGHASVGAWLAVAADLYLKVRARAGNPIPLAWHRGRLRVLLGGEEVELDGMISPPFGIYCGTGNAPGYPGRHRHTLVHLATREVIATLRTSRQAKDLAAELAPTWLRDRDLASRIIERHERESA